MTCSAGLVPETLYEIKAAVKIQVSTGGVASRWTCSGLPMLGVIQQSSGAQARLSHLRLGVQVRSQDAYHRTNLTVSTCVGAKVGRLRQMRASRGISLCALTGTGGRAGRWVAHQRIRTAAGNPARNQTEPRRRRARPGESEAGSAKRCGASRRSEWGVRGVGVLCDKETSRSLPRLSVLKAKDQPRPVLVCGALLPPPAPAT